MPTTKVDPHAIPCVKCGYDLRVTPLHAHCPECGTPVLHSKPGYRVEGDMLVVRSKVTLPRQYYGAKQPGRLRDYSASLVPAQAHYMPIPKPMKFRYVPGWLQAVCQLGPVMMTAMVFAAAKYMLPASTSMTAGQIVVVTLVVGLVVGEVVQHVVGKECRITIYSCPAAFGKNVVTLLLAAAIVFAIAIVCMLTVALFNRLGLERWGALSTVVIVLVGIVGLVVMSRLTSVRLVRYADGEFWIKGFGQGYLQTCQAVRARIHDEARAATGTSNIRSEETRGDAGE